jgi:hypothetical protein
VRPKKHDAGGHRTRSPSRQGVGFFLMTFFFFLPITGGRETERESRGVALRQATRPGNQAERGLRRDGRAAEKGKKWRLGFRREKEKNKAKTRVTSNY